MIKLNNKAALFGFDARVALVVLAVLSTLAGAKLSSYISETSFNAIFVESKNIGKAIDNYHNDVSKSIVNSFVSTITTDAEKEEKAITLLYSKKNLDPALATKWNGPYIKKLNEDHKNENLLLQYRLVSLANDLSTTCNTSNTNPCYVFLLFKGLGNIICDDVEDNNSKNLVKITRTVNTTETCNLYIKLTSDYN